jgi:GalNAc5-diNAcBac-PP-undecaprenol beta-1,3-glucosyltransferase
MSSDAPFFSIVVPTYNRKGLLLVALKTAFDQSFRDFELVLVDDGSTDGTETEVQARYSNEPRLRFIRQENAERGAARNTGLRNARGRYVVFFDSDDRMQPEYLELLHEAIVTQHEPALVATHFCFVDEQGNERKSDIQQYPAGYYDYRLFLNGNPLACNVAVRRALPDLELFVEDRRYAVKEDWMFLLANTRKHPLYLAGRVGLKMLDHPGRSMLADHASFVDKTRLATDWILHHVPLTDHERKLVRAHAAYLSAIHRYLEGQRIGVHQEIGKAIRLGGFRRKYALLYLKSLVGYQFLRKIRGR